LEFFSLRARADALDRLARHGADATVLAGGTIVMVQVSRGEIAPSVVLHVEGVRDLATHGVVDGRPTFGALTTNRTIATDAALMRTHAGLAQAAGRCGGWQTQSVGTIGGNVCAAWPTSDLLPALLAHGAHVTLQAAGRAERRLPLDAFLQDAPARTARLPDELLTRIDIDACPPRTADSTIKVGRRGAMEVAVVGLAVRLTLADDDRISDIRIAVGAVGPRAWRATEAEAMLRDHTVSPDRLRAAGDALAQQAAPVSDYRRAVLPRLLARAVNDCATGARA
jgi:carbon-monoxide dehydrogenase medium subunit